MNFIAVSFIFILGSINHFLYSKTKNKYLAYFVSVNESVFEHLKLAVYPSFIWFIIDIHHNLGNSNVYFAMLISLICNILLIPFLFYGYQRLFKKNNFIFDILIFLFSIIISRIVFNYFLNQKNITLFLYHLSIVGLIIIFLVFMTFTYTPLKNKLFKDPKTGKCGI